LLQSKAVNFLIQITQNFLKPELLKHILTNFTFSEQHNHKSINDINLGSECEEYLLKLVKKGHVDVVSNIRQNCLQFYITAAEEIKKRLPVNDIFLYKLHIFQPHIALLDNNRETSFNDVSFIAKVLTGFDENGLKEEWLALYHDFTIEEKQNLSTLNFDNMWKEILKRQLNNIAKYPNLKSLLNAIRSLPHSNADSERIFSLLTDIKTNKRNRLSAATVNATCVFKSALKTRGETALDMRVNEKHLSLMSTSTLYAIPAKKTINSLKLYAVDSAGPSSSNDTQ